MIRLAPTSLDTVLDHIRSESPFSLSRWGDGEWHSVLGTHKRRNCDQHRFFPEMGVSLANILRSKPKYSVGIQPLALKTMGDRINRWLSKNSVDLIWSDADVFHLGAMAGRLDEIVDAVFSRNLLLVGPTHLAQLQSRLNYNHFVAVPSRDCFRAVDKIVTRASAWLDNQDQPSLVAISASMPAEIILDRLYSVHGNYHSFVDFGSLWDPLVGILSRGYMRNND